MFVYINTFIYIYTYVYMYTYLYIFNHLCKCACMFVYTHTHTYIKMHISIYIHTYKYADVHINHPPSLVSPSQIERAYQHSIWQSNHLLPHTHANSHHQSTCGHYLSYAHTHNQSTRGPIHKMSAGDIEQHHRPQCVHDCRIAVKTGVQLAFTLWQIYTRTLIERAKRCVGLP